MRIIRRDKNNVTNTKNSHKFKATFILIFRIDYIANWEGTFKFHFIFISSVEKKIILVNEGHRHIEIYILKIFFNENPVISA